MFQNLGSPFGRGSCGTFLKVGKLESYFQENKVRKISYKVRDKRFMGRIPRTLSVGICGAFITASTKYLAATVRPSYCHCHRKEKKPS